MDGALRFVMPFHDDVVGRPGYLHGGAIAGLLEFAAFTALTRAIDDENVEPIGRQNANTGREIEPSDRMFVQRRGLKRVG